MNVFFQAIQAHFDAEPRNDFYSALNGEFYYGEALGRASEYAVYFGLPGVPEDTWSDSINDVSFQVNCYAPSPAQAGELLEKCLLLFSGSALQINGYQDVWLKTEMFTPPWRDGERWASSAEFQGYLIKR